jgi:hypothetical protein
MSETANQIIGAVLATLGAVAAVFITDWFRDWRKAKYDLPTRLTDDCAYAQYRGEIIDAEFARATYPYRLTKSMRFDVPSYQRLSYDTFTQLSTEQRKTLANIIFAMSETDEANAATIEEAKDPGITSMTLRPSEAAMRKEQFLLDRVRDLITAYRNLP